MSRHIFRLTNYKNIVQFLNDGAIYSKNHVPMQRCYQTSYENIVDRRGTAEFKTPCGSVVNDFVPFYFSPITAMAYAIHNGNVSLKNLDGDVVGIAKSNEIVFLVSSSKHYEGAHIPFYFTDVACNSQAKIPKFTNDLSLLDSHVNWRLFEEVPYKARIPEIEYNGACRYFQNRDDGLHTNRNSQRMAEFLIQDKVSLQYVDCIIAKDHDTKIIIERQIQASIWNIPVYAKPDCYF